MRASSISRLVRARLARRATDGIWRGGSVPVNTIVAGTRTLIRGCVALALLPLLIDRVGAAPAGLFLFATTLTGYFASVEYGFGLSVTKYVAEHRVTQDAEMLGSVLRASLVLMVGIGALVGVALALLGLLGAHALFDAPAIRSQALPTLLVAAVTALLYWPSRIGTSSLEGLERYDLSSIVQIVSSLSAIALILVLTEWTHSIALLAAVFGATQVLEGVAAGVLARPQLALRRGVGRWRGAHLRPALGFGGGLFLIGLSETFIYALDRTIVAAFAGAAAIVIYEVALRPHNAVRMISGLIGTVLLSTSSRLVAEDRSERLRELMLVGSLYTVILAVPCVVLIMLLAGPLVEAWVGHGYGRYAAYVQIFVSYWLVYVNTSVLVSAVAGSGRIRELVRLTVVNAVVSLALSIGLTAAWGVVGVIWGTVIPGWLILVPWMHYALREVGIAKARYAREVLIPGYLPIAAWTLPVMGLARVLQPHGVLQLGAFCALALLALWMALLPILRARWRGLLVDGSAPIAVTVAAQ
jgi:O-antigen/teichoic acid export membrane protein